MGRIIRHLRSATIGFPVSLSSFNALRVAWTASAISLLGFALLGMDALRRQLKR
jgi:hypothetical protein